MQMASLQQFLEKQATALQNKSAIQPFEPAGWSSECTQNQKTGF
jgi:hypothetical protein